MKLTLKTLIAEGDLVFEIAAFEVLLIFEVDKTPFDILLPELFFALIGDRFLPPLVFKVSVEFAELLNLAMFFCSSFSHIHKT